MIALLQIPIECGETTCAHEPGKFCPFVGTVRMGTVPVCRLFPTDTMPHTELQSSSPAGWLLRCSACLEAEKQ